MLFLCSEEPKLHGDPGLTTVLCDTRKRAAILLEQRAVMGQEEQAPTDQEGITSLLLMIC